MSKTTIEWLRYLLYMYLFALISVPAQTIPKADADIPGYRAGYASGFELSLNKAETEGDGASLQVEHGAPLIRFQSGKARPSIEFLFSPVDLSTATGLELRLGNHGKEDLRVYGMLNGNAWVTDYVVVHPGKSESLRIYLQRTAFHPACTETSYRGMNGVPGGQMKLWPEAEINAASIHTLTLYAIGLRKPAEITIEGVSPFLAPQPKDSACGTQGFVDRYGQNQFAQWPDKIGSDDQLRRASQEEYQDLIAHPAPKNYDRFGGWRSGPKFAATGHFSVRKLHGRWWFIDPDGYLFWSQGITAIQFHEPTEVASRAGYFLDPAPDGDFLARNLQIKYGAEWESTIRNKTILRMKSWGLNTIGPWSDEAVTDRHNAVYTYLFSSRNDAGKIDPYSEAWYRQLRERIAEKATAINQDPWCLGIFVDNEIHDSMDPVWWETYSRKVRSLLHELLPNKLYLGSRLDFVDFPRVDANRLEIARIAARYTDVVSFNQYRYTLEDFSLPSGVDRPVLVGEFHFGALTNGMLHTGLRSVRDPSQRSEAYIHYVESALRNPNIIGVHWFQMYDEPLTGRGDGENYQIGFLDICDKPYKETIAASRYLGNILYPLRYVGHK